jgi:rhomboid family GlyGly-CTERM serine protease
MDGLGLGIAWLKCYRITFAISVASILMFSFPNLASAFQLDFDAVGGGQWWRLITGHLAHYGGQHLFWDLLMFIVLGALCERKAPRTYGPGLVLMALGVSLTVLFTSEGISEYRGLSGIDTGLFTWFICDQLRLSHRSNDRVFVAFWGTLGTLLVGKLVYEVLTGNVLFVQTDGFVALVESHLSGALVGVLLGTLACCVGDSQGKIESAI